MEKLVKLLEKRKNYYQELNEITEKDFKDFVEGFLEKNKDHVVAVAWRQYTPYFMDGDPCEFTYDGLQLIPNKFIDRNAAKCGSDVVYDLTKADDAEDFVVDGGIDDYIVNGVDPKYGFPMEENLLESYLEKDIDTNKLVNYDLFLSMSGLCDFMSMKFGERGCVGSCLRKQDGSFDWYIDKSWRCGY